MTEQKKIIIDDQEIEVDGAMTLIQACEIVGIEIPRFCYHERLSIAGNCRMCLVEVVGGPPKPTASCAMQVKDLRPGPDGQPPVVRTNSKMVKKAQNSQTRPKIQKNVLNKVKTLLILALFKMHSVFKLQ